MIRYIILTFAVLWFVLLAPLAMAGNCGHFWPHKVHHAQAVALVQPLYLAGQATQDEALLRKALRAELPKILQEMQIRGMADEGSRDGSGFDVQQHPINKSIVSIKCATCHSGENPKGGIDLTDSIGDDVFRRSMEILAGENVPTAMKQVVANLKDGDHAALMSEMLNRKPQEGVLR